MKPIGYVVCCTRSDCPKIYKSCERKDCAPTKGKYWNDGVYRPLIWTPPYIKKMIAYKSKITGTEYASRPFVYREDAELKFNGHIKEYGRMPMEGEQLDGYINHGYGGVYEWNTKKNGDNVTFKYLDLPKDEYPYLNVYDENEENCRPDWMK